MHLNAEGVNIKIINDPVGRKQKFTEMTVHFNRTITVPLHSPFLFFFFFSLLELDFA